MSNNQWAQPTPIRPDGTNLLPFPVNALPPIIGDMAQTDFSHLKYMMICGCGFPNSKQNFEPAVMQFKLMFPNNHTIITVPESPMFNAPEATEVTVPRLELVKQAGKQYAETGEIDVKLLAEICSPMIPEDVYAAICNRRS